MVDTRAVTDRRSLRFETLADILADAEALDRTASIRATGNWTPAQNVAHVAGGIAMAIDGFGGLRAPEEARAAAATRLAAMLERGFPAGIEVPEPMQRVVFPGPETRWADALAALRTAVARAAREPMTADHPVLGVLSPEQWTRFHCRHAELHLGFLHPVPA